MLLNYLDESYDREHYWICALACRDANAIPLTEALDRVVLKAASAYGVPRRAELHAHDLFHGKNDWERLAVMPRARIGVYHDAFAAIAQHAAAVVTRGVHVPGLRARYANPHHPHKVVLQHLLERIDLYAAQQGEHALVIADEIDHASDYRADLWRFQREPTPGYRARRLTRVVDTMHFAPSTASRLLQAADLVAYLHRRMNSRADRDPRAVRANTALWARIEHLVWEWGCWYP